MANMDAKVLRRAAELVEQGWARYSLAGGCAPWDSAAESWCAVGALDRALVEIGLVDYPKAGRIGYISVGSSPYNALCRAAGLGSVIAWNDAPERTGDEVAAALRAAADRCEASEPEGRGHP